jgi:hypothetical protein
MLNKIQKRIEDELEKIIKKERLSQKDYNILSGERSRLEYIENQKEINKHTTTILKITEKMAEEYAARQYDN